MKMWHMYGNVTEVEQMAYEKKLLCDLEGWFNTMNTDLNLQHLILVHLQSWRNDTLTITAPTAFLEEILYSQRAISWPRFFEGWISNDWSAAQQDYYISKNVCELEKDGLWL